MPIDQRNLQKKSESYLNQRQRNFPVNVSNIRTDICNYRIASLLKSVYPWLPNVTLQAENG